MKNPETFIKQLSYQINKQILKASTPSKPSSNIIDDMKMESGSSKALIVEIHFLMKWAMQVYWFISAIKMSNDIFRKDKEFQPYTFSADP